MDAILQAPPLRIESSEGLRRLEQILDENLLAMEAMSINIKVNCFFWVHIVSEKLDPEIRREWELDSAGDDIRKIDDLPKFIIRRGRALETSEKIKLLSLRSEKQFQTSSHKQQTVQSYNATAVHCPISSDQHKVFQCDLFKKNVTDRET